MATPDIRNIAVFCDFENVAIGVKESSTPDFRIRPILERLLLKGSIVVKKAYCDWDRYKEYKRDMHEAAFELIEIPHVRQSGKNSADIRMVVDALDLCYTKTHIDAFVIISGDSDFSPLISKLKENGKSVIGIGVRGSASSLLVGNCDEFIFYEDLVPIKATPKAPAKKPAAAAKAVKDATSKETQRPTRAGKNGDGRLGPTGGQGRTRPGRKEARSDRTRGGDGGSARRGTRRRRFDFCIADQEHHQARPPRFQRVGLRLQRVWKDSGRCAQAGFAGGGQARRRRRHRQPAALPGLMRKPSGNFSKAAASPGRAQSGHEMTQR
jgi:uncharacterized protein (TIGR00288 family)